MQSEKLIKYWCETSDEDANTMHHLYEKGDYSWALFLSHIVLEKLLKVAVVRNTGEQPPLIHDLSRLAIKTGLDFSSEQLDQLDIITTFNIRARYDDYKREFKAKCTKEYAEKMIIIVEELRTWIKNTL